MKSKIFFLTCLIGILYSTNVLSQISRLINNQCGRSVILGEPIFAEPVDSVDIYEFKFFTDDTSVNKTITSATSVLEYKYYAGLPEYFELKICVRTKRGNTWSIYGDTCNLVIVSDCSFNTRVRENVDTEEKMLKLQSDLQDIINLVGTIDLTTTTEIIIPVVFHVIVPASYTGDPYDYLPPAKINESIQILNELYDGVRSNQPEATDCKINFCPAMNYRLNTNTMQSLSCQHLGITYYGITYNTIGVTDVNLPAGFPFYISDLDPNSYVIPYQTYFPDNQYLNIFIFDDLADYSAVGYAGSETFGSNINYVILERAIVGTNSTITRYEGYTVGHEAGHYFGLDHTWGGAYSTNSCSEGDFIDDTPAHSGQNLSCDELSNSCTVEPFNDPVHNLMNYSSDGCRNHLTHDQAEWMHAVQQLFYPELPYTDAVSEGYDIYCQTIPSIEGASIEGPAEMIRCTGEATIAIYVNDASTFNLDIVDNVTSTVIDAFDNADFTACGSNYCINYNFTTEGVYRIELTVFASPTYSQTIIRNYIIQECDSLVNNLERAHWHFDHTANMDFSSGIGQLGQTAISAIPAEVSVCSETGDLLFYTNGHDIWNRDHVLQSISLDGNFEASKGLIALNFGLNAGVHNYMMVYLDANLNLYYRFIAIDASYNISFTSAHQQLITTTDLIANGINFASLSAMGVSASPKPDLTGYWLLSSLKDNVTSTYYPVAIEINYNSPYVGGDINISTFNTLTPPATYPDNEYETTIKMSPDAKYLVYSVPYSENKFYIFNSQSGEINDQVICSFNNFFNKFFEVAFSKDSKFMYMTEIFMPNTQDTMNVFYRIKQVDLDDIDMCDCQLYGKTIFEKNSALDLTYNKNIFFLQEGPDDRIYFSRQSDIEDNAKYMGIIMYPENPATYSSTDNECGAYGDFIHYPSNEWIKNDLYLPNFVDAKPDSCDLDFRICSANCNELNVLNLSHGYDSTFTWSFDNGINNYNYTGYTPQDIDTLAYSDLWTISLSKLGCTDTLSQEISFTGFTVNIEGNDTICNDSVLYYYNCGTGFNLITWSVNGSAFSNQSELGLLGSNYTSGSTVVIIANVTNQFGCHAVDTFNVYISGFEYELISSLDCSNIVPGEVQINITGQPGMNYTANIDGFNYNVGNGNNQPYTDLYPGVHSYGVSDYYCNYSGNFVTAENLLVDSISVSTQCPGDTSDIIVWFSGGSAPYDINFSGNTFISNDNNFGVSGIIHGNYALTITDSFGCKLDTTLIIKMNVPTVQIFQSGENYCSNDNNVNLVAVANSGTPAYQFQWGGFENPILFFGTDNLLENLISFPEAIYVTVTDANGCIAIDSLLIPSIISPLLLDIEAINPCGNLFDGEMDLTITGTNAITDMYWLIPDGNSGVDTIFNQQDLQNLINDGIYRVWIWDEFGCVYNSLSVINTYDEPFVQQPLCSWDLGSITTNWDFPETLGENSYSSSNWLINEFGDTIPENMGCFDSLPSGTYILYHSDGQGCTMTDTIEIIELEPMQYSVDVEYYSDSLGNPMFTSTISVWGENSPYYIPYNGLGYVHLCYGTADFTVIQDAIQPAVYQVTGNVNNCPGTPPPDNPYFQILSQPCGSLTAYIFDTLPNIHDTIHLDTLVSPIKCIPEGGELIIYNISSDLGYVPVFFTLTSETTPPIIQTITWDGDPNENVVFSNLTVGTYTLSYWNAFSEVNYINVIVENVWDMVLQGTITSGSNPSYSNITIAAGQIIIESGASLTLTNCDVYTAYYNYSTISQTLWDVKNGGKLYLSHDTIIAGCEDKMWQGIKVTGQNSTQSLTTFGNVQIYYSLLADAMIGIQSVTGGIIKAQYSDFINNSYDLYFNTFNYDHNITSILKNDFLTDDFLNNISYVPKAHVYMNSVKKISINGNTFKNTMAYNSIEYGLNPYYADYRGYGIQGLNSSFTVTKLGTNWQPISFTYVNYFEGLYYAIMVNGQKTTAPQIAHNTFVNNFRGVMLQATTGARLIFNDFSTTNEEINLSSAVPIITGTPSTNVSFAAYINSCQSYSVEENSAKNGDAGIYIYNTGDAGGLNLYRNTFGEAVSGTAHDMTSASVIVGKNSNYIPGDLNYWGQNGLQVRCNNFIDNNTAIGVVNGNMRKLQGTSGGTSSDLAGNQFHEINTNGWDFTRSIAPSYSQFNLGTYSYYQHDDDYSVNNDYYRELTANVTGVVGNTQFGIGFLNSNTCQSNYLSGIIIDLPIVISGISNLEAELTGLQQRYDSIVDLGDTEYAKAVATLMNNQNYAQAYEILRNEGYLTDTVLTALLCNEIAPSAAIVAILIENSPLPEKVVKLIDAVNIDSNLKNLLMAYQTGLNTRVALEYRISDVQQEIYSIENKLMNHAMNNDSTSKVREQVISYFEKQKSYSWEAYINIYKLHMANSDINASLTTISELRNFAAGLPEEKSLEVSRYCEINEVYLTIIDDIEKDTRYLDAKKELLYDAALDESPMYSALAEILYEYATDSIYTEYTPLPWEEMIPKSVTANAKPEDIFKPELKVYPNPTSGLIFVQYDFSKTYSEGYDLLLKAMKLNRENNCNKGEIVIYSEDGKLLKRIELSMVADFKTIDFTDFTPGVYIIEISDCYENKNTVKITKTK
ncbi:MAG: M43 family zinc metalloprotease [Bacteroidales bacterium]